MSTFFMGAIASLFSMFVSDYSGLEGSVNRENQPIEITVTFYDSPAEVTKKFKEINNIPTLRRIPLRQGFAVWEEWIDENGKPNDEIYTCQIHTIRPLRIDDSATTILGHELLHCIYGSYHRSLIY